MFIFICCLIISIVSHELAHMIMAILCGVKVKIFSIGFGRPIISKKWKDIDFRLSWIPIGGYCDLKGMESKKDKDDFLSKRYHQKFMILIAGVLVNFLIALICYQINYGSVLNGLYVDLILIKLMLTKDYYSVVVLLQGLNVNIFLMQLSIINLFGAMANILPIPALDGGHLWLVLMEKIWKDNFVKYYTRITKISFVVLMIVQIIIVIFLWT